VGIKLPFHGLSQRELPIKPPKTKTKCVISLRSEQAGSRSASTVTTHKLWGHKFSFLHFLFGQTLEAHTAFYPMGLTGSFPGKM
jgi:hypothetical protein